MKRNLKSVAAFTDATPFTENQVRWWIFNASTNGLSSAIVRIGRRICIDIDRFDDWLSAQNSPADKVTA
ncbi:MAG: DNA-binding protein [Rhodanobacteraceae bacterium]|nr:DNA-binding protein [Rhodanobacteraceae bacterium]